MKVKLARLSLKEIPHETLPINAKIGDVFEVIGYAREATMVDNFNHRIHFLPVYYIMSNEGYDIAPCELFDIAQME